MSNEAATPPPSAWQSTVYGVLAHPVEPRIMLLAGLNEWSLPHTQVDEPLWVANAAQSLYSALHRDFGIAVPVLRCASYLEDEPSQTTHIILALEPAPAAWSPPPGAQWVDRSQLARLTLARPEQLAVIERCLDEQIDSALPGQRPSWARPGWFAEATAWIEHEIARQGYELTAPIAYEKTWGISVVLRARTISGDLFFKQAARLPLFADEPVLTTALAQLYPAHVPSPVAIDAARGWMLLRDIGIPQREQPDGARFEAAIRAWGDLQRASTKQIEQLLAVGCLDRRLDVLAAQIDPLLDDAETHALMEADELAELRRLAPHLKALCQRVQSYGIPPALLHGDLHWGNIALGDDYIVFFDWTDSCIAHPFLDLATLLDLPTALPDRDGVRVRLRTSYLEGWTDYEPLDRLEAAADCAEILGALHQAVSYLHIATGVEAASKHELASGLPHFLGRTLTALRAYLARDPKPFDSAAPG